VSSAAPSIKAIPTSYESVLYRSRLEARWAIFLTELDINFQYEPEGYRLESGYYLPDFWLPDIDEDEGGAFLEIKPSRWDNEQMFCICPKCGKRGIEHCGKSDRIHSMYAVAHKTFTAQDVRIVRAAIKARNHRFH
jgi:hypothetical protein